MDTQQKTLLKLSKLLTSWSSLSGINIWMSGNGRNEMNLNQLNQMNQLNKIKTSKLSIRKPVERVELKPGHAVSTEWVTRIFLGFGPTCQEIFTGHVASTEWYTTMISFISSKKVHVNGQNFCQNSVIFEYLALLGPCFGLFFENQIFPGHANSGEWWTRMSYSILRIKING